MDYDKFCNEEALKHKDEIINLRRKIHMNPELAYEEEKTAILIEKELKSLGISSKRSSGTGVICEIKGESSGPIVALRADMDALAIKEETNFNYKSKISGKMHACGHDAHVAMLLGCARILVAMKKHIAGSIRLIFQPAEEGGGGAVRIIDEGHLKDVSAIFGIHVWTDIPSGEVIVKKGPLLASSDCFEITIEGKGGHGAIPHQAIDPTSVLADIYNALQKIISREKDPFEPVVLTTAVLQGSNAENIIPQTAILKGTLRTFKEEVRVYFKQRIVDIAHGYAEAWRCKAKIDFDSNYYPPLINDDYLGDLILKNFEESSIIDKPVSMGSEDFSFYAQKIPGLMILLGTYNQEKNCVYSHHHPKFSIDEDILAQGAALYSRMALCSLKYMC